MNHRKRAFLGLGILLIFALAIAGCTSDEFASLLGGGGGFTPVAHTPVVAVVADFFGQVHSYKVNATTGELTEAPGSPIAVNLSGDCPWAVVVTPDGKYAYVGDQCSGEVEGYSINSSTGDLTSLGVTLLANNNDVPWVSSMAITADSKYLYVSDDVQLNGFSINSSTGALTALAGFPMTLGNEPFSVATSPDGKYLYVSDDTDDTIYGFSVNTSTGALTAVPGSPFPSGQSSTEAITVDGAAKFVYTCSQSDSAIAGFTIGSNGALTSTGAATPSDPACFQVVPDPLGRYLYSMNDTNANVNSYTINSTTGVLTNTAGSPFTPPGESQGGAVDPSGKFLYSGDCDNDATDGMAIGSGGALSNLAGSPFGSTGGSCYGGVAVTHQ